MKLSKAQQEFLEAVKFADKYGEVAYMEFGMFKPWNRRTADSLVKRGLIEYVDSVWEAAWFRLVKEA